MKKEQTICQSLPCLDLASFPVLRRLKLQAPLHRLSGHLIYVCNVCVLVLCWCGCVCVVCLFIFVVVRSCGGVLLYGCVRGEPR